MSLICNTLLVIFFEISTLLLCFIFLFFAATGVVPCRLASSKITAKQWTTEIHKLALNCAIFHEKLPWTTSHLDFCVPGTMLHLIPPFSLVNIHIFPVLSDCPAARLLSHLFCTGHYPFPTQHCFCTDVQWALMTFAISIHVWDLEKTHLSAGPVSNSIPMSLCLAQAPLWSYCVSHMHSFSNVREKLLQTKYIIQSVVCAMMWQLASTHGSPHGMSLPIGLMLSPATSKANSIPPTEDAMDGVLV